MKQAHIQNFPQPQPKVTVEMLLLQVIQLLQDQQQANTAPTQPLPPVTPEKETMDVAETAKYLRVSEWTVYDLVRTKQIPHFRIKQRIFFRRREIENWIALQAQ